MRSTENTRNRGAFYAGLLLLSLAMMLCLSWVPASAASAEYKDKNQGLTWRYEVLGDHTLRIHGVSLASNLKSVSIPKSLPVGSNGAALYVSEIIYDQSYTFSKKLTSMETLQIPNTVTKIDFDAFSGCANLTTVTFEQNSKLTSLGERAFYNCKKLNQFAFPSSLQIIYGSCFRYTNLKNIDLSSTKVTSIMIYAFADTYARTLKLPLTIQKIQTYAFGQSAPSGDNTKYTYPGTDAQWAAVSVGGGNYLEKDTTPPPPSATVNSTPSYYVTPTNATIKVVFTASEVGFWTSSGVRLYDSTGKVIASKHEDHNYKMKELSVWYDVNKELGKTLTPNTTYSFEIYTHFNGEEKTCTRTSFKTQEKTTMTWTNEVSNVTSNSFTFTVKGKANKEGKYTSFSYAVDDVNTGEHVLPYTTVTDDPNLNVSGAEWLKIQKTPDSYLLHPGHTYAYQVDYVFDGTRYVSDRYTVTLPDPYGPYLPDREIYAYDYGRNFFTISVDARDTHEVAGMTCYVYNSVDGPEKKVQVYPDIDTNQWVHSDWIMSGWLTVNIDDVGGTRGCYYSVEVTAWDRSGNRSTSVINADDALYIKGERSEVTAAQITNPGRNAFTLRAESAYGHYPYNIESFRAVVYPEGGLPEEGVWAEVPASYDSTDRAYKCEGVVDISALALTESQTCNVDVYAVEVRSGWTSEALPLTVWIDADGPEVSDFRMALGDDDVLRLSCVVEDDSALGETKFSTYKMDENGDYTGRDIDAVLENGRWTASVPFAEIANEDGVSHVFTYFVDSCGNLDQYRHVYLVKRPGGALLRIPSGVKAIDEEAFAGVDAEEVILPSGCVSIGSGAFRDCGSLRFITVPDSVTEIADDAIPAGATIICEEGSAAAAYAAENGNNWGELYK